MAERVGKNKTLPIRSRLGDSAQKGNRMSDQYGIHRVLVGDNWTFMGRPIHLIVMVSNCAPETT
jgi:hypothetical protein